ncbi:MAG TPA: DNA-processing protein DprA [Ktedonobacterales bacterium]|nr:DNA-processing protein DprA [Ktedonobacterales bacterium]
MPAKRRDPLPPDDAQALLFPEPASTVSAMAGWSGPLTPLAPETRDGIPSAVAYTPVERVLTSAVDMADMNDPDLPYWLALNRIKGIGPARFKLLYDALGSAQAAWQAMPSDWQTAGLDARTAAAFEQQRRRINPAAEVERLVKTRVGVVRLIDDGYPRLLREIAAPPPLLYLRGALKPEDEWAIAIVGTRRVSAYGRQVTERLATELVGQRITVVSGLARGVDSCAHTAALAAGGRTIAVLGCGPDLVYPPENARLAARIVEEAGGAIITEYAPGVQPEAGNFPARNRIISGLSLATLITEAPEDSGAMITARFAGEQGRDVLAVPGPITSRGSGGTNRLIQDGAKLIMDVNDVLAELNLHLVPQQMELREELPADAVEAQLLAALRAAGDPQHIDDLCRATGLPTAQVSGALVMMELKGLARLVGPMTYAP